MKTLLRGQGARGGPPDGAEPSSGGLAEELRRCGFDLRRAVEVTYLLELGQDRDGAYAIRDRAAADGWHATLFGDASGWVVRIGRFGLARQQLLDRDASYLEELIDELGGRPRGVCVEDLDRAGVWEQLAAAACESAAHDVALHGSVADEEPLRLPVQRETGRAAHAQGA